MDEMRRMMLEQMQGGGGQPQPQQMQRGPQMPQMPDQGQQLQQRLQQRLNPRIGTLQDSDPQSMAQFMVRSNPQQASSLLTRMLAMMNGGGQQRERFALTPQMPPARPIGHWNPPELSEGAPGLHMEPAVRRQGAN